ncbi:MAG: hypothetical protein K2V38_05020 [Gemmataceae bacterium]|nr:hypothetical protein [Gemmataceae bacterium]
MNAVETHTPATQTPPAETGRQRPALSPLLRAIVYGGLVSGVLDATDGVVAFGLYGFNPIQVMQFIASGAFGPAALDGGQLTAGGLLMAAAGAGFHFVIAFVAAGVFAVAARSFPVLRRNWVVAGLVYGAWVWVFMNLIVLPFTAVVPGPSGIALTLNGVIGHALFVGLPIAYFARFQIPGAKLRDGDPFPLDRLETVGGRTVRPGDARLLHVQFRRWVGCPICNTHVGQLIRRADAINAAGVREVLVFHSTADDIRTFRDDVPFDLVADPTKRLYATVGAETSLCSARKRCWPRSAGCCDGRCRSRCGTGRPACRRSS